jgi:FKBP-type peptidyl-prolyl cis-trans isomerase
MKALSYKIEQRPQSIKELKKYLDNISFEDTDSGTEILNEIPVELQGNDRSQKDSSVPTEVIHEIKQKPLIDTGSKSNSKTIIPVSLVAIVLIVFSGIYMYNNQSIQNTFLNSEKQLELKNSADSAAYSIGVDLGNNIKKNLPEAPGGKSLDPKIILDAFRAIMKGETIMIDSTKASAITQAYFVKSQTIEGGSNKEFGQRFLANNGKRAGVTTTASGLQYEVIKTGTGPKPAAENTVKVHYHGTLIDGTVFDSSVARGEPVTFALGQVIKGWTEALLLMPVGSKWKIYIPSELGYGEQAAGPKIKPNSVLIFEVELISIEK